MAMRFTKFVVSQEGNPPSRYILFVRSGASKPLVLSHYQHFSEITVVLSFYEEPNYKLLDEWWVVLGGRSKFESAKQFLDAYPLFFLSSLIGFFDPDISINYASLLRLFSEGEKVNSCLYQACLSENSHGSWPFLYKSASMDGWEKVSFVEVMAPIFRSSFLRTVYSSFADSISTWGLEYIWYANAREPLMVNNDIEISHINPINTLDGPFYTYLKTIGVDPWREKAILRSTYTYSYYKEMKLPRRLPWMLANFYFLILRVREKLGPLIKLLVQST